MAWSKEITQLVRAAKFSVECFLEDEDAERLAEALEALHEVAEQVGLETLEVTEEEEAPN